jgi:hypothetical protein
VVGKTLDQSCEAEAYPKLFEEFIDKQNLLSKTGMLPAGEGLLRAAGHFPGSKRPKGWREAKDGFGRRTDDRKYTLKVIGRDGHWFVLRRASRSIDDLEYFALAFDKVPLCTRTVEEAMRLAEHFYPDPDKTVPGLWVPCFSF